MHIKFFQLAIQGISDFLCGTTPRLVCRVIDTHGRSGWAPFELRADELVTGVVSWPAKVSGEERQRQENYEKGKGYYEFHSAD